MSGEINVIQRTQMIVVQPVSKSVGIINGNGPVGPQGPIGLTGATGATGATGPQGPAGTSGAISSTIALQTLRDSASSAASNNAASNFNAVSDPNFRVLTSLYGLNYVTLQGRLGGTLAAVTKLRVQYAVTSDPNLSTSSGLWTTLLDSAGGHASGTMFGSSVFNVPAPAKVNSVLLRCGIYDGDGVQDPTITACILNFYA